MIAEFNSLDRGSPSITGSVRVTLELVTDLEQFNHLRSEWDELWDKTSYAHHHQSYTYCHNTLLTYATIEHTKLICIVGRYEGRLVFIWPLMTYKRAYWKILKPLGPEAPQYSCPLIAEGFQRYMDAAWSYLKKAHLADVINMNYVKIGSELHRVISNDTRTFVEVRPEDVAPYVIIRNQDWAAYVARLSQSHRKKHANMRRRLAKEGKVEFEIVNAGDMRCGALIASLLAHKRHWADKVNKHGDWLYSPLYEAWLKAMYREPSQTEKYLIFVLRLDGKPIAIKLAAVCKSHLELIIAGFDNEYGKFSPGMRLDEYWVKWAVEQSLDIDFAPGGENYKMFWAKNNVFKTLTFHVAGNFWGWLGIMILRQKRKIADWRQARGRAAYARVCDRPSELAGGH